MADRIDNEVLFADLAGRVCAQEAEAHGGQMAFAFLEETLTPDPSPLRGEGGISWEEARRRSETARGELEGKYYAALVEGLTLTPGPSPLRGEGGNRNGENFDWWPRYEYLVERGWPWRVAAFIGWATMPKRYRTPRTQEELAVEFLGLTSDRVIGTWRQKYPEIDLVIREFAADPLLAHLGEVMSALVVSAADPSYRHHRDRQVYLEMVGKYKQSQDITLQTDIDGAQDLTRLDEKARRERAAVVRDAVKKGKNV